MKLHLTCLIIASSLIASGQGKINFADLNNTTLLIIRFAPIDSHFTSVTALTKWHNSDKVLKAVNESIDYYNEHLDELNAAIEQDWSQYYKGSYKLISLSELADKKYSNKNEFRFVLYYKIEYYEDVESTTANGTVGAFPYLLDRNQKNYAYSWPIGIQSLFSKHIEVAKSLNSAKKKKQEYNYKPVIIHLED